MRACVRASTNPAPPLRFSRRHTHFGVVEEKTRTDGLSSRVAIEVSVVDDVDDDEEGAVVVAGDVGCRFEKGGPGLDEGSEGGGGRVVRYCY